MVPPFTDTRTVGPGLGQGPMRAVQVWSRHPGPGGVVLPRGALLAGRVYKAYIGVSVHERVNLDVQGAVWALEGVGQRTERWVGGVLGGELF